MNPQYVTQENINAFITNALSEDQGSGDHSSLSSIPAGKKHKARLLVKDDGVIAGIELARAIFHHIDPSLQLEMYHSDGDMVEKGGIAFEVAGDVRSILLAERLVLNCMQRMSGIATKTRHFTDMISHTEAVLLDTRKTTPCFRMAEKWAVHIGGGRNHRFGLYDLIMLKDNHIDFAGGLEKAIESSKAYVKEHNLTIKIEVETRNLEEVAKVLAIGGVDIIMLDNMTPTTMKEAVALINGQCKVEASGGITEETIVAVAETGVDFISVGALTHSYKSLDLSLKAIKGE